MLRQVELLEKVKSYMILMLRRNPHSLCFFMKPWQSNKSFWRSLLFSSLEVAGILAEHKFDSRTIITALLHDVVEDTNFDLDAIASFGPEISLFVDGVTKLSKFEGRSISLIKQKISENYY